MMMRGKVGAFSYYVSETRQIVRQAQNNSNFGDTATRAPKQQTRRVKWANLVNFYSGNKGWMKKAFENLKPGVSIFNAFMAANIPLGTVALTKAQAKTKLCVLQNFIVSQGSLPSITPGSAQASQRSSVASEISGTMSEVTVGEFSQSIVANNGGFKNGDAIAAIGFNATDVGPTGDSKYFTPASYRYYEFVIDVNSEDKMSDKYPKWNVAGGFVACSGLHPSIGYAYVHTRTSGGKLVVSTERIVIEEEFDSVPKLWETQAQVDKATDSYNVETPVMLVPGGTTSGESGTDNNPGTGGGGGGDDDENLGE